MPDSQLPGVHLHLVEGVGEVHVVDIVFPLLLAWKIGGDGVLRGEQSLYFGAGKFGVGTMERCGSSQPAALS